MASSVVVDMQGSFGRRAGRGRPVVSPAGRRGRDSRRRAGGSRLRERAWRELSGRRASPLQSARGQETTGTKLIAENRRSRHDYELLERVEAGIVLTRHRGEGAAGGARPARPGLRATCAAARCGSSAPRSPSTPRATSRTTSPIATASSCSSGARSTRSTPRCREKGLTLVPTKLYFKDGKVKLEIALGRGKDKGDKRRTIADRDAKRQMERALKARR